MNVLERLRADLAIALRDRGSLEVSTIRTLIAAIENAEAIDAEPSAEPKMGLGHDRPRKDLGAEEVAEIIEREWAEVSEAVSHYRRLGSTRRLEDLSSRLRVIDRYRSS